MTTHENPFHEVKPGTDQHTPPPWMVFKKDFFISVCTVGQVGERKRIAKDISEANAAFIVKAVNTYESDQKKIERLISTLDMIDDLGNVDGTYTNKQLLSLIEQLRHEIRGVIREARK